MDKILPLELYEEDIKLIMLTDYWCKQLIACLGLRKKNWPIFFFSRSLLTTLPWPSLQSQIKMR